MLSNNFIKKAASEIGLDICQITDGGELKKEKEILIKRAKKGYWPQPLTNQDINQLTKPALHFDNLKSIIVLGINYNNHSKNNYISNYITQKDYHLVLEEKMEKLIVKLRENYNFNFNYKIFVDTAPFLERAVAKKAGAGFIGKNTMLINPDFGSYIFLGEIFIDIDIEKDEKLAIDCGDCKICLDNCEGGALKDKYFLLADDCISYLTQKKGVLTEKENKKIAAHIWGCDACQNKCPYNKIKSKNKLAEMNFFDRGLEYYLKLERKKPPSELKNKALIWRGSRILLRNALIVTANQNQGKYIDLVKEKVNDNSPIIKYYAIYTLLKLDYFKGSKAAKKLLKTEKDKDFKDKIKRLLLK